MLTLLLRGMSSGLPYHERKTHTHSAAAKQQKFLFFGLKDSAGFVHSSGDK